MSTGAKIVGHRGYFLTNDGIDLNQALISYGLDFLRSRGYKKIQPPFKPKVASAVDVSNFDEVFTSEEPLDSVVEGSKLSGDVQEQFAGFSYDGTNMPVSP